MAALDFPVSPTTGQLFSAANGVTYIYNGTLWLVQAGPGGGTGDFTGVYTGSDFGIVAAGAVLGVPTIVTGNSGGWYNTSNARYTPPAGRYYIWGKLACFCSTTATGFFLSIRKNGVTVLTMEDSGPISTIVEPTVSSTFDANGTDYFELFASGGINYTGRRLSFGAFPLTGMQGPQGAPPTAGGGIIRDITLASPAPTIDLFSLGCKTVQLVFYMEPVTDNVSMYIRTASGTTVSVAAAYYAQGLFSTGATAPASVNSGAITALEVVNSCSNSVGRGSSGTIMFNMAGSSIVRATGSAHWNTSPSFTYYLTTKSFQAPLGDGLQVMFSSGNIAAGSFVRVIGWP